MTPLQKTRTIPLKPELVCQGAWFWFLSKDTRSIQTWEVFKLYNKGVDADLCSFIFI